MRTGPWCPALDVFEAASAGAGRMSHLGNPRAAEATSRMNLHKRRRKGVSGVTTGRVGRRSRKKVVPRHVKPLLNGWLWEEVEEAHL